MPCDGKISVVVTGIMQEPFKDGIESIYQLQMDYDLDVAEDQIAERLSKEIQTYQPAA